jgi:hypothetical protein
MRPKRAFSRASWSSRLQASRADRGDLRIVEDTINALSISFCIMFIIETKGILQDLRKILHRSHALTLVQGFQNEISSDLAGNIERVLIKTNLNTHSMLGSYTMLYDNLLYIEYTREFWCAYSHVHVGTQTPKLILGYGEWFTSVIGSVSSLRL